MNVLHAVNHVLCAVADSTSSCKSSLAQLISTTRNQGGVLPGARKPDAVVGLLDNKCEMSTMNAGMAAYNKVRPKREGQC